MAPLVSVTLQRRFFTVRLRTDCEKSFIKTVNLIKTVKVYRPVESDAFGVVEKGQMDVHVGRQSEIAYLLVVGPITKVQLTQNFVVDGGRPHDRSVSKDQDVLFVSVAFLGRYFFCAMTIHSTIQLTSFSDFFLIFF